MLQRIQTVYLLIVILVMALLPFWSYAYLWIEIYEGAFYIKNELLFYVIFFGSATLAFITIFLFKNRKLQFVLNRLNILINLFLLGVFVYKVLTLSNISEKGFGLLLPVLAIIFLVLANKAIKKDENLIKSVDRLR